VEVPEGYLRKASARSRGYGYSGLMKDILVYRKGLPGTILKDKERERELAADKEIGGWRLGIRTRG